MSSHSIDSLVIYLAGFFDGEGTVHIEHRKWLNRKMGKYYEDWQLNIGIGNNCRRPLDLFVRVFGGRINVPKTPSPGRCCFVLNLHGPRAAKALERMVPFLTVKRKQAVCGVKFQKRVASTYNRKLGLSEEEKKARSELRMEVKRLNARYNSRAKRYLETGVYNGFRSEQGSGD